MRGTRRRSYGAVPVSDVQSARARFVGLNLAFLSFGFLVFYLLTGFFSPARAESEILKAIKDGKPHIDVRLRYEHVDQDLVPNNADAITVRTRLGYETAPLKGAQVLVEFEDIQPLGAEDYNSTTNGRTTFPVVADPDSTELNRFQLTYKGIPETTAVIGRQRILMDNQRFIGNVGWRQNEQTFDAVLISNKSLPNTTATYFFVDQVNRIFGKDSPVGRFDTKTHGINIAHEVLPIGRVVGYVYLFDNEDVAALSSASFGVRLTGSQPIANDISVQYTAEYAYQKDYRANPASFDHSYVHGEAMVVTKELKVGVGYERLEGDGTTAFQTPLATLHKFQGWADVFLTTPTTGIEDLYGQAALSFKDVGPAKAVTAKLIYHDFNAERGGADLGKEWNALLVTKFDHGISAGVKYANYTADTFATDRQKFWVWIQFKL